jgi:predicted HTH transcriptional regulator
MEFPDISTETIFPYPESTTFEFKEAFLAASKDKLFPTLCGLLNAGGGFMVIGVRDSDRAITGINPLSKDYDRFLLQIDGFMHQRMLRNHTDPTKPISHLVITSFLKTSLNKKTILVIQATPEPDTQYETNDGTVWHRLNASNFRQTTSVALFTQQQLDSAVQSVRDSYRNYEFDKNKEFASVLAVSKELETRLKQSQRELSESKRVLDQTKLELSETKKQLEIEKLFSRILKEKEQAEIALQKQEESFWFCCGF